YPPIKVPLTHSHNAAAMQHLSSSAHKPRAHRANRNGNDIAYVNRKTVYFLHGLNLSLRKKENEFHVPTIRIGAADRTALHLDGIKLHFVCQRSLKYGSQIEGIGSRKGFRPLLRRDP